MVKITIDKINSLLEQLEGIQIKEVVSLRNRLEKEKEKLTPAVPTTKPSKEQIQISANKNRSSKLKRYWRYIKLIRDNFPDLSTSQIRLQLKHRRQGLETKIPDAIWQNPSG